MDPKKAYRPPDAHRWTTIDPGDPSPFLLSIRFFFQTPSLRKRIIPFIKQSFSKYYLLAPFHVVGYVLWTIFHRAANIPHELMFDRRYGTTTSFLVLLRDLNFADLDRQRHATRYRPVSPRQAARAINYLRKHHLGDSIHSVPFIEYGCGAGRGLIVAATLGFEKLIGIELSPALVEYCEENWRKYTDRLPSRQPKSISILIQDAATFEPPPGSLVPFFHGPFSHDVFRQVIENIEKADSSTPRDIFVIDIRSDFDYGPHGYVMIKKMFETRLFHRRFE